MLLECDADTRSRVDDTQPPPTVLAAVRLCHMAAIRYYDWIHLDRARAPRHMRGR